MWISGRRVLQGEDTANEDPKVQICLLIREPQEGQCSWSRRRATVGGNEVRVTARDWTCGPWWQLRTFFYRDVKPLGGILHMRRAWLDLWFDVKILAPVSRLDSQGWEQKQRGQHGTCCSSHVSKMMVARCVRDGGGESDYLLDVF